MKKVFQSIYDFFFSHEKQLASVVSKFEKASVKLEVVGDKIRSKIAEDKATITELEASIKTRVELAVKTDRIASNFKQLLGED